MGVNWTRNHLRQLLCGIHTHINICKASASGRRRSSLERSRKCRDRSQQAVKRGPRSAYRSVRVGAIDAGTLASMWRFDTHRSLPLGI